MFKKIVVPLGDSEHTETALYNACQVAAVFKASVVCLHVIDEEKIEAGFNERAYAPELLDAVQKELLREERFAKELFYRYDEKFKELEMELKSISGSIGEVLLSMEEDADLVVSGKMFFDETDVTDLGPRLEQYLHKSSLPIMVCTKDNFIGTNLLASYDGGKHSLKALTYAIELALKFKTRLNVLTISEDEEKAGKMGGEAVKQARFMGLEDVNLIKVPYNPVGSILGEAHRMEINLMFIGAFGHSGLRELVLGSTTLEVLRQAQCPVMVCR